MDFKEQEEVDALVVLNFLFFPSKAKILLTTTTEKKSQPKMIPKCDVKNVQNALMSGRCSLFIVHNTLSLLKEWISHDLTPALTNIFSSSRRLYICFCTTPNLLGILIPFFFHWR